MRYLGGKAKIARELSEVMLSLCPARDVYWEPFLGGANVFERMAPNFSYALGTDAQPDLIMMWQALQAGWNPPEEVSREDYAALRHAEPSALRGFAGFGCSFGGKWFAGYGTNGARDGRASLAPESRRAVLRQAGAVSGTGGVTFAVGSYSDFNPPPGSVIYCDPPYKGTTSYAGTEKFDHAAFWGTCVEWAESGCHVFVSEYDGPGAPIWQRERDNGISGGVNGSARKAKECLFYLPSAVDPVEEGRAR